MALMACNGGCWGRKFFQAPRETLETSVKVDSLLKENMILQRRIYQVEKSLEEQRDYSRSVNAQTKIDLEELKDQLNALLQLLEEEGRAAAYRLDRETGAGRPGGEDSPSVSPDSLPVSVDEEFPGADSASVASPGTVPTAEEIHRQIYLDFSRMEYQIALDESDIFLREYADHPLEQEVRLIRGECFTELEKYFDALKEFSSILQKYPRGEQVPPALLRMAVAYDKIGDRDLAAGVVRRLVREYPESEEAAVARERFPGMLSD